MKIGILGFRSFVQSLLQDSPAELEVWIYPEHQQAHEMTLPPNWHVEYSLEHLFQEVNLIFIDLSWNEFSLLANQIRTLIADRHVLVSLNKGFSLKKLDQLLNERKQILMTKSPLANLSQCPVVLLFGDSVESQEKGALMQLFPKTTESQTEEEFQILRGIVEQAPFLVATVLDALCDGAWVNGVSRQQAFQLAWQSVQGFLGSTSQPFPLQKMMNQHRLSSSCTLTLEKHNFRYAIIDALQQVKQP